MLVFCRLSQVGKSTLIKCLVKHYTRQNLAEVLGPITVVAGAWDRFTSSYTALSCLQRSLKSLHFHCEKETQKQNIGRLCMALA